MVWILVVMFVHHGLLVDRQELYVDQGRFSSFEECRARGDLMRSAYRSYYESICVQVKPAAGGSGKKGARG